jgi:hypothetical protein
MRPLYVAADQLHDVYTQLVTQAMGAQCQAIADALYAAAANLAWSIAALYQSHNEQIMATLWLDTASRCAAHIAAIA